MIPSPSSLINSSSTGDQADIPEVEQLGVITLEQLNQYHCNNPDRRLVSLYGVCFDCTSSLTSYGPDGAYKEYAGHDITLAISNHKTGEEWLDKFVKMTEDQNKKAKGWKEFYEAKYRPCATLDVDFENQDSWPELTEEEQEAFSKGCTIM
jgi:hypothetical protein